MQLLMPLTITKTYLTLRNRRRHRTECVGVVPKVSCLKGKGIYMGNVSRLDHAWELGNINYFETKINRSSCSCYIKGLYER